MTRLEISADLLLIKTFSILHGQLDQRAFKVKSVRQHFQPPSGGAGKPFRSASMPIDPLRLLEIKPRSIGWLLHRDEQERHLRSP
jgi:hypothetical protein